jgi:hypothetical protein
MRRPFVHLLSLSTLLNTVTDTDSSSDKQFLTHLPSLYVLATDVLLTESAPEVREAVRAIFVKVGQVKDIVPREWA